MTIQATEGAPASIYDLPDEILLGILDRLPVSDLLSTGQTKISQP